MEPGSTPPDWDERARLGGLAGVLDPYDTVGAKNRLIDRAHKRAILHHVGRLRGRSVLDFGCGNGRISAWLVSRGAIVHGVDTSSEMVAQAQARVPAARFDLLDRELAFEEAGYDIALSVGVLCFLPEEELTESLSRLRGALNPRGRIVALEKVSDGTPEKGWTLDLYRRCFATAGLTLSTIALVRLGYSSVIGLVVKRPFIAGFPLLPFLLELEAKRQVDKGFAGGQYGDCVFVATHRDK